MKQPICLQCNKEFKGYRGNPNKFCSPTCTSKFNWSDPIYRQHMSDVHKGQIGYWKNKELSQNTKDKISISKIGKPSSKKGKKFAPLSETHKQKLREISLRLGFKPPIMRGKDNPMWVEDRSLIKINERSNLNYSIWRKEVGKRDNFQCKINNKDCKGQLETHHILGWKEYPELRYDINNGITLCLAHHPRGRANEKRMVSTFMELLSVSKENNNG